MREDRGSIRGLTRREFLAASAGVGAGLVLLGGAEAVQAVVQALVPDN